MKIKLYNKAFSTAHWYRFRVQDRKAVMNDRPGWRVRLAWFFRSLADRLDGRESLAMDMESLPALPKAERNAAMNRGLDYAETLFATMVADEAMTVALHEYRPDLCQGGDTQ
ncbi:hypothetical protein [Marinobacter sp. MDS2]|uniref:hypothetical protein n=1 Tax=Marinobacter sp. MDS2 TaxID=3065961 RepID=UPI00273C2D16|nr:hypothetical protein [Marinobacter sp. MDS2]MDP4546512.1 hypothetical protein [Marinobacter sp. MDS2]